MFGPIDYIVVGFAGNNFDGSVLNALSEAVDKNIIRIIDLLFVMKDSEGNIIEGEYEDQSEDVKELMAGLDYSDDAGIPLLSEDDIIKIGEMLPNEAAAGVLVIEHLWAKDIKKALLQADGFLVADGRLHPDAVDLAVRELEVSSV